MIRESEEENVLFNEGGKYTANYVKSVFDSSDSESSELRNRSISLVSAVIEGEEAPRFKVSTEFFFVTLHVLKAIGDRILTFRVINLMRDRIAHASISGNLEDIEEYARRMGLRIKYDPIDLSLSIGFVDFVRYCSRVSGYQYRLVSQVMRNGEVILEKEIAAHIIREFFVSRATEVYDSIDADEAMKALSNYADFIGNARSEFAILRAKSKIDLGNVDSTKFPPCVSEYIRQIREGTNLPHLARFTMVSFLHKIGMDNPGIMDIFRSAPDFNEKVTAYQVNHITGEISGTQYSPPKCAVLQSNHLCYKENDPLCAQEWLSHPLRYYMIKKKPKNQSSG